MYPNRCIFAQSGSRVLCTTMEMYANRTGNLSDDDIDVPLQHDCLLYDFIIYTVIVGALVVVGIIGNSLAFVVFWKDTIKTSTSFLFQALSLIDSVLLVSVFLLYTMDSFVAYTDMLQGLSTTRPYRIAWSFPVAMTAQAASIWVTVLIAVNRYVAVCLPYKASRWCTVLMAKKQLAVVLLIAVLYSAPTFSQSRVAHGTSENGTTYAFVTYTKIGSNRLYQIIYENILYSIFLLALPVLCLTLLNIRLVNALKALRQRRLEMQTLSQKHDNSVTFVLIIVVVVLIICQLPALVNRVLWNVLPPEATVCGRFQYYLGDIANALVILNSSVNFIIYAFLNKRFRRVLVRTVCACQGGGCLVRTVCACQGGGCQTGNHVELSPRSDQLCRDDRTGETVVTDTRL